MNDQDLDATWVELQALSSTRDADPGEPLAVIVDSGLQSEEEVLRFSSSDRDKLTLYRWPNYLCQTINANSRYIRGGEKNANGEIVPISSSYRNKLWRPLQTPLRVYLVVPQLNNWVEQQTIRSTGAIMPGTIYHIVVLRDQHALEHLSFEITRGQNGHFQWPGYLSRYINSQGLRVRAGEKNEQSQRFDTLSSQFRNKMWVPVSSGLRLSIGMALPSSAKEIGHKVFLATRSLYQTAPADSATIDRWLVGFTNGRFADITYPPAGKPVNDTQSLAEHLARARAIANYVLSHRTAPAHYTQSAIDALVNYARSNFITANWWQRQIGLAREAGVTCILLADLITDDARTPFHDVLRYLRVQSNIYGEGGVHVGANLADVALIQLFWGAASFRVFLATDDLNHLAAVSETISSLCLPVGRAGSEGGEGIQIDYSFSQHNPIRGGVPCMQLYTGSYGGVLLSSIFQCHRLLSGALALTPQSVTELARFLARGCGWNIHAGQWDWQVLGRSISRAPGSNSAIALSRYVDWLDLPEDHESFAQLQELKARVITGDETTNELYVGNRVFWINEYMAHFTPGFGCRAKVISTRTVGTETGNGENAKGYFMGAGSYFLSRHGEEFSGIQPCWNWQSIPGTTVEQIENFVYPDTPWGKNAWGSHAFAGGASDGSIGLLSFKLTRGNVKDAFKTLFALSDRVVAAGSAINTSSAIATVSTSVNQARLRTSVHVFHADGGARVLSAEESYSARDIVGVWHDGLHYRFPASAQQRLRVTRAHRTGAWRDINVGGSTELVRAEIFSLAVEHGRGAGQSYQYEIVPGEVQDIPAQTLSVDVQPARHAVIGALSTMASFASVPAGPGVRVADRLTIVPDAPIFMVASVNASGSRLQVTVADPTQALQRVQLAVEISASRARFTLVVDLPQGERLGAAADFTFPLSKAVDGQRFTLP